MTHWGDMESFGTVAWDSSDAGAGAGSGLLLFSFIGFCSVPFSVVLCRVNLYSLDPGDVSARRGISHKDDFGIFYS